MPINSFKCPYLDAESCLMEEKHISTKDAYSRAAALCSRSEKCISDIETKLYQWKLPAKQHEIVIKQLTEEKFIDESRFTSFFVRDKFRFNKWGKVKIAYQLSSKGIAKQIISEALDQINADEYESTLKELIQQKERSLKYKDEWDKKQKLLRFVVSRGFESYIAQDLIE